MYAQPADYGASVKCDGSDPLRFAVLTTRAGVSTALRRPAGG
jgi:hypothetical protein